MINSERQDCVTVAFVHLGPNPSPITLRMAHYAKQGTGVDQVVLLTDRPSGWGDFPGPVYPYHRSPGDSWLGELEKKYPEKKHDSGGYWIHTLERLVALDHLRDVLSDRPVVHLEGDVFANISTDIARTLIRTYELVAYPRVSESLACASFMFIPDHASLEEFVSSLRELVQLRDSWLNDMQLLSEALIQNVAETLPTDPEDALQVVTENGFQIRHSVCSPHVIFDGAAIGQYLFGQDPFHTNGCRLSGHVRNDFSPMIDAWNWRVKAVSPTEASLECGTPGHPVIVANVHVHAKVDPGEFVRPPTGLWKSALAEANGATPRQPHFDNYLGHERKPAPLWARLLSWRTDGWDRMRQSVSYRISLIPRHHRQ